jgi:hypothetical protein
LKSLELFNTTGQKINQQIVDETNSQINLEGLTTGIYYLAVKTSIGMITRKIVRN